MLNLIKRRFNYIFEKEDHPTLLKDDLTVSTSIVDISDLYVLVCVC